MTDLKQEQKKRLIARLQKIAREHQSQPEIAAMFLRLADDIALDRKPGTTSD